MKRILLLMLMVASCSLTACSSSTEEGAGRTEEELRDQAKHNAAEMEDIAEEADTTAVVQEP